MQSTLLLHKPLNHILPQSLGFSQLTNSVATAWHMAMSHLFGCMDCPPSPEPFWDLENLESDMEKNMTYQYGWKEKSGIWSKIYICPSSPKSMCYFSVCH